MTDAERITPTLRPSVALELTLATVKGERCIRIVCKNKKRLTLHGFGLFLENVDPREVAVGKGVIEALLEQPLRMGLQGMEFWPDYRLAFCAGLVPLKYINVPTGAKKWIKSFAILHNVEFTRKHR